LLIISGVAPGAPPISGFSANWGSGAKSRQKSIDLINDWDKEGRTLHIQYGPKG
jgi:hypothetical protein